MGTPACTGLGRDMFQGKGSGQTTGLLWEEAQEECGEQGGRSQGQLLLLLQEERGIPFGRRGQGRRPLQGW